LLVVPSLLERICSGGLETAAMAGRGSLPEGSLFLGFDSSTQKVSSLSQCLPLLQFIWALDLVFAVVAV